MTRLIYSGIFDELPGLKIISHHMGGMIPYFSGKINLGFRQIFFGTSERNPAAEEAGLKRRPIDYYKMLYADTALGGESRRRAAATRSSEPRARCSRPTRRSTPSRGRRSSATPSTRSRRWRFQGRAGAHLRRQRPRAAQADGRRGAQDRDTGMRTQNVRVKLRDGEMGAYIAYPDTTPAGAIIAIMEIWGVNDTMRRHAHDFAEAGFVCLVPDLFWRQDPGSSSATTIPST